MVVVQNKSVFSRDRHEQVFDRMRKIVGVSDFQDGWPPTEMLPSRSEWIKAWTSRRKTEVAQQETPSSPGIRVEGGYLERLPLACVACGLVDHAQIWGHWRPSAPPPTRRFFHLNDGTAPFASDDMLAHIEVFGRPDILWLWGLGVAEDILIACETSFKVYNSIDAPALRILTKLSAPSELILTGEDGEKLRNQAADLGLAIDLNVVPELKQVRM